VLPDAANPLRARKVLPARLAPPALLDRSVLPDLKDCKDRKDLLERKAQPVTGARPAHRALRDRSALKARRVNPEHKDQPVLPVRAANPGRTRAWRTARACRPARTKGDPGPTATFRVVTGTGSVSCGDDELLVSLVCATGATAGVKCVAPDAAATGLCVRK
jgi:hypothetical protein